jgi:hypothetical protein
MTRIAKIPVESKAAEMVPVRLDRLRIAVNGENNPVPRVLEP